jgi:hypothetical protein
MKTISSKVKMIAAGLVLATTGSVNAATVSFGSAADLNGVAQFATDGSGLTSVNVPADNLTNGLNGFFIETFDTATQTLNQVEPVFLPDGVTPNLTVGVPFEDGTQEYNDTVGGPFDDCAINGTGSGININTSGAGSFGVRTGSVTQRAAAPAGDETCFGFTPQERASLPSFVEIDYSDFLAQNGDVGITFLGFYWGSIDQFNDFSFFSGDNEIQTITGTSLLNDAGGQSGDQEGPGSNLYVALDFDFSEAFDRVRITSRSVAGEFDNIVIGLQNRPVDPVPAPAGLAFLGLGLVALGLRKRLKK